MKSRILRLVSGILVLATVFVKSHASDWARFRGPNGSGVTDIYKIKRPVTKSLPDVPSVLVYKDVIYLVKKGGIVTTPPAIADGRIYIIRTRSSLYSFGQVARPNEAKLDIKQFVRATYHHGVPYDQASRFGAEVVPILLEMLKDPNEKQSWSNIIYTLGIIGNERAVGPLIRFLESDVHGDVDLTHLNALLSVQPALGHIAAKGSVEALEYLLSASRPERWRVKGIPWRSPNMSGEALYDPLAKSAIIGLGISAQPNAIGELRVMHREYGISETIRVAASEALQMAEQIRQQGRERFFRARR